jgi:hypothetical protein
LTNNDIVHVSNYCQRDVHCFGQEFVITQEAPD